MNRKTFIAGNWKMNGHVAQTRELCQDILELSQNRGNVIVAVCPPFTSLQTAAEILEGSGIMVGAQNMHQASSGAFTGEISAAMLLTVGCQLVILGHSERRHLFGETDETVNRKVFAALASGLHVILCVGEMLEDRERELTTEVVERQLTGGLKGISQSQLGAVTIAYEPVWAIGTGKVATVKQAGEVHRTIRRWIDEHYDSTAASMIRIQYGGSVKAENAKGLLSDPDIDGALVGGASLDAKEFDAIIRAAI